MGLLRRQPGIAVFTLVEVAGLALWLGIVDGTTAIDPLRVAGTTVPVDLLGLSVLFVALVAEHALAAATVRGRGLRLPKIPGILVSVSETGLWGVWLFAADAIGGLVGIAVAGVVLAALMVPQHSIEDGGVRARGLLSNPFDLGTVSFSLVEAVGASVWLALVRFPDLASRFDVVERATDALAVEPAVVGLLLLVGFLFVEHNMGVRFALRRSTAAARVTDAPTAH